MTKRNRVLTVLFAAMVLFVMLFSEFYIAVEADHDCTGEDCPVCCQITICENTLKSVGQAVIAVTLAAFVCVLMIFLPSFAKKTAYNTSLVTLKVKLSN